MKKIVYMLLTVLVVMSLFLCVTVSAEGEGATLASGAETTADAAPESETADVTTAEQDLGGIFSLPRLALAGQMIVQGLGMIFLVLAILWGVLVIFKKIMYDAPMKKAAKAETAKAAEKSGTPAVESPAEPETPTVEEDGAVVAAITAAVAAMIASDEPLSSQFADGFRVVSFKRKSADKRSGWNR